MSHIFIRHQFYNHKIIFLEDCKINHDNNTLSSDSVTQHMKTL